MAPRSPLTSSRGSSCSTRRSITGSGVSTPRSPDSIRRRAGAPRGDYDPRPESQRAPEDLDESLDLLVPVVERDGRHANHVRLAPVAGDAGCFELFEDFS